MCGSLWHFITKGNKYYHKMRQLFYYIMRYKFIIRHFLYYKMRQLLQNDSILLQNVTVVKKCDVYHKIRQCTSISWTEQNLNSSFLKINFSFCLTYFDSILDCFIEQHFLNSERKISPSWNLSCRHQALNNTAWKCP